MSSAAFYKWRAKFGGMGASLMARTKELERGKRPPKKDGSSSFCVDLISMNQIHTNTKIQKVDAGSIFHHAYRANSVAHE